MRPDRPKPKAPFLSDPIPWIGRGITAALTVLGEVVIRGCSSIRATIPSGRSAPTPVSVRKPSVPGCLLCGGVLGKSVVTERNPALYLMGCGLFLVFAFAAVAALVSVIGLLAFFPLALLALGSLFLGARRRKVWRCTSCKAIAGER